MIQTKQQTLNSTNTLVQSDRPSATYRNQLTILRTSYLDLLGNIRKKTRYCAAKLLNYFQNWQNWKQEAQRTDWIYQPLRKIREDLLEEYSLHVIREAIASLIEEGFLERRNNPGNGQDKTYQYRLLPKAKLGAPQKHPSPRSHTQSPSVKTESSDSKSESWDFNVETHHRFISKDFVPTAAVVAVDLKNESLDNEVDDLEPSVAISDSINLNDIQEAQEEALNHLEVVNNVKEELKVIASISSEDHSSPAACVNSIQSKPECTNDVVSEVESLVGDEMNPQLEHFVLSQSVAVVREAIAFVKEKLAKGQTVKKKAGYLITAIRNQFKPTPSTTVVQSQKFPAGFEEWYAEATEKGQIENRELRHLSISNGQPMVFVPNQGRSMVWYEAQALFAGTNDLAASTEPEPLADYPVEIPTVGSWVKFQDAAWKVEKIEGDLVQTLNLWNPSLNQRVEGVLPLQLSP